VDDIQAGSGQLGDELVKLTISYKGTVLFDGDVDEFQWQESGGAVLAQARIASAAPAPAVKKKAGGAAGGAAGLIEALMAAKKPADKPAAVEPEPVEFVEYGGTDG